MNTLKLEDLLELVFFIATHYAGEFSGADISLKFNDPELHQFLNKAIRVFDNWAVNYYEFIEWWRTQDKKYYVSRKQIYSPENQLPREHRQYDLFNYVLHYYLDIKKFVFMHEDFKSFLNKFIV